MKKFIFVFIVAISVLCFAASSFAGALQPGQSTSCKNANSITLEASGNHPEDRGNANAVIWKSSNYTTVPITLGPTDDHGMAGERGVGMPDKFSKGQKTIVLKKQSNFSRGDSIGDISGEVKITNTGTIDINVNCG
ncbi:MAG: hypothetical protein NPINA01_31070 [Nitrospinaceae bacterium]|nr:MAG: hypothetical protein NPINA01_31070 [Nitrospinaceae bacterium]